MEQQEGAGLCSELGSLTRTVLANLRHCWELKERKTLTSTSELNRKVVPPSAQGRVLTVNLPHVQVCPTDQHAALQVAAAAPKQEPGVIFWRPWVWGLGACHPLQPCSSPHHTAGVSVWCTGPLSLHEEKSWKSHNFPCGWENNNFHYSICGRPGC